MWQVQSETVATDKEIVLTGFENRGKQKQKEYKSFGLYYDNSIFV